MSIPKTPATPKKAAAPDVAAMAAAAPAARPRVSGPRWLSQLRLCMAANSAALVWGPPGVGKTDIIGALHRELFDDLPFIPLVVSTLDPTELHGLTIASEGGDVRRAPWEWAKALVEAGGGTVFLDELTTAPPATQAAALRLVLEKVAGDTVLPESVRFVAAANPPDCAAGGFDLSPPMANRFAHLHVGAYDTPAKSEALSRELAPAWIDWVTRTFSGTPEDRKAAVCVAGFIGSNPGALFSYPTNEADRGGAWASPRSWAALTRVLSTASGSGDWDAALDLAGAFVGSGVSSAFRTHARNADLPAPRDLLTGAASYAFDRSRADLARAVLLGAQLEAVHGETATPADRAALVEAAWSLVLAACDGGLTEATTDAAKALARWRSTPAAQGGSGVPHVRGTNEQAGMVRLGRVIPQAKRAAGIV